MNTEQVENKKKIFTVNILPHFTSESIYDKLVFKPKKKNTSIMEKFCLKQTDFFFQHVVSHLPKGRKKRVKGRNKKKENENEYRNFTLNLSNNKLFNLTASIFNRSKNKLNKKFFWVM